MKKISALALFFACGICSPSSAAQFGRDMCAVIGESVAVREKPELGAKIIRYAWRGESFTVTDKTKDRFLLSKNGRSMTKEDKNPDAFPWYRVTLSQKKYGWIYGKLLGINADSQYIDSKNNALINSIRGQGIKVDLNGDGKEEHVWFALLTDDPGFKYVTIAVSDGRGRAFFLSDSDPKLNLKEDRFLKGTKLLVDRVAYEIDFNSLKAAKIRNSRRSNIILDLGGPFLNTTLTIGLEGNRLVVLSRKDRKP